MGLVIKASSCNRKIAIFSSSYKVRLVSRDWVWWRTFRIWWISVSVN